MRLAFDIKKMRPGCVLIAAALGADPVAARRFPTESWLLSPTSDMGVYETTEDQLAQLIERVEAVH